MSPHFAPTSRGLLLRCFVTVPPLKSTYPAVGNRTAKVYAHAMSRTIKLMTFGIFGVWLLTSTGCEDKACKADLAMCKKEASDQKKECTGHQTTITELKALLAETQAKVETLSKENDELKAKSAEPQAKGKGKAPKAAKHKKKKGRH
jgi:hypothetical protein